MLKQRLILGSIHAIFNGIGYVPWNGMKRACAQKFPDWLPGARNANGTDICH